MSVIGKKDNIGLLLPLWPAKCPLARAKKKKKKEGLKIRLRPLRKAKFSVHLSTPVTPSWTYYLNLFSLAIIYIWPLWKGTTAGARITLLFVWAFIC